MERVTTGVREFLTQIAPQKQDEYRELAKGQQPEALLITCSDSRIVPGLITQSDPGVIFVIRNAGNIVPKHDAPIGGEAATIEYAIRFLKIPHVIVCGHTGCGAMQGLLNRSAVTSLLLVDEWLNHAQPALEAVQAKVTDRKIETDDLVRQNVLAQLENLKTYPFVTDALTANELTLHGWMYEIATGQVLHYDADRDDFVPLVSSSGDGEITT